MPAQNEHPWPEAALPLSAAPMHAPHRIHARPQDPTTPALQVAALPLDKAEKLQHKAKGVSALMQYIQDNAKPATTKKLDLPPSKPTSQSMMSTSLPRLGRRRCNRYYVVVTGI